VTGAKERRHAFDFAALEAEINVQPRSLRDRAANAWARQHGEQRAIREQQIDRFRGYALDKLREALGVDAATVGKRVLVD
jgi:hypothetical protein